MIDQPALHIALPEGAIRAYCQKWGIRQLALFGSVLRDDFTNQSDVDVLLTFAPDMHYTLFDLAGMGDELEAILGRKVDLLTRKGIEENPNYIRRKSILSSAQVVYAEG
jgi:hypothetical protein